MKNIKNEIKNKSYLEQQKGLQSSQEQGLLQPYFFCNSVYHCYLFAGYSKKL
jgi:hypothetical protein